MTPQLRDTPELRSFAVAKFKYLFLGFSPQFCLRIRILWKIYYHKYIFLEELSL